MTVTVTHKLVDPAGDPIQMGGLITLGGFYGAEFRRVQAMSVEGQQVSAVAADSDAMGAWSTELVPNASMDLENLLYRYQPASGDPVFFIVPATGGPYELRTIIAITPGTPAHVVTGPPGPPGPPLDMGVPVTSASALPTTGTANEAHLADDTGHVWVWTVDETTQVGSWVDTGRFRGDSLAGPANTLTPGTATTGAPGTEMSFTITGEAPNQTLNLTIPRGDEGAPGPLIVWRYDWSAATAYVAGDGVSYSGSSYICVAPVTSATTPDVDTAHWGILARAGTDGAGTVTSVAGVSPDGTGDIPLTAADVHAHPDTWKPGVADIDATGTADGTTVLYGDGTWKPAPSGGGGAAGINASSTATQIAIETAKDWIAVSDAGLWTGEVLGYLIGSAFDPYKSLQTIQQVADNSGAASVLQGNSNALGAVQRSTIGYTVFGPLFGVKVGDPFMGGFYVGIIDTTKGNIITADANQSGKRYGLIVSPKTLETTKKWKTTNDAGPAGVQTRWDGLGATLAMANAGTAYEAATYCNGLTAPVDAASQWYLPAIDELELLYRNLKPVTYNNYTSSASSTFPPVAQFPGVNPSSDPAGAAYTTADPAQTIVAAFKTGGAEVIGQTYYWCATEGSASDAWKQTFTYSSNAGQQNTTNKTNSGGVRPVRRLILSS